MPYIERDESGAVVGWYAAPQEGRELEFVPPGHPDDAPPSVAAPVPDISDRQFFQELARRGIITSDEALAAVKTGDIPAALASLIEGMKGDARFAAEMLLSGATTFQRNHPLTDAIGAAWGMTSADIDAFFAAARAL